MQNTYLKDFSRSPAEGSRCLCLWGRGRLSDLPRDLPRGGWPGAHNFYAQAADLVRVTALPCTREHCKINFHQKNTYDLEDFFACFCHGSREHPAGSGSRQRQQGAASRQQYAGGMQQAAVPASSSRQLRQAAVGRLRADTSSQAGSIRQQQAVAATGSSR